MMLLGELNGEKWSSGSPKCNGVGKMGGSESFRNGTPAKKQDFVFCLRAHAVRRTRKIEEINDYRTLSILLIKHAT
jgi:hypothetical protein